MPDSPCPPAERLWELLAGGLPDGEQATLVAHLDGCADCQRALEDAAGADPALLAAASDLRRTAYLEEQPLRQVLDTLGTDPELSAVYHRQNRAEWVRSLLRPAAVAGA